MISLVLPMLVAIRVAVCRGQDSDYRYQRQPLPLILMHKQALSHDGRFNYAFATDNGLKQGESIDPDGNRSGAYSYVDPSGQTISVKYTAGKDGFKILEGDHVPKPAPLQQASTFLQYSGPQAATTPRQASRHYDENSGGGVNSASAYTHARDGPGSLSAYRVQEDDSGSYDGRDGYDPVSDQHQHKGPHSFGSGYAFQFGG